MAVDEATLEETVSHLAIQRLLAAYADAVNRRAWSEFEGLFLADARIEVTPSQREPLVLTGPTELGRFIGDAIEHFEFFQFVYLNQRLELRAGEETARGRNFMVEMRQEKATGRWSRVFGVYHDHYRRVDGRWWFAQRAFDPLLATGRDNLVFDFPEKFETLLDME